MNFHFDAVSFLFRPSRAEGKRKGGYPNEESVILATGICHADYSGHSAGRGLSGGHPVSAQRQRRHHWSAGVLAIELATEIINNEHPELDLPFAETAGIPGLDGGKLLLTVSDTQGNAEIGQSEAERLIDTILR